MKRGGVLFVLGVSGSGKTTLARALAAERGAVFLEGDEFHPPQNVASMRAGIPLTDEMRWDWLRALADAAAREAAAGRDVVVACSGLKRSYRDLLRQRAGPCRMVMLNGAAELIRARMKARQGHYMPASLLDSQFAALEMPQADEDGIAVIDVDAAPDEVLARARELDLG